ncbi:MAG TPA: Asp-tRNA(Asn)/Glu-tRNA(Gln) amidotransferase subunit GatA, partial [Synergistaceae bacterium]|nr:Asp-tRNA(Asn)/Glu-tRNA(Gln) amidotransferase subunit GatA [Synergistaceae bacterium]
MELWEYPGWRIAQFVSRKELSVEDVVRAHLGRIALCEPHIEGLITLMEDQALERAKKLDISIQKGEPLPSPLCGVPVIIKDNMCFQGAPTTCGSKMLENWHPPYNASVVEYLEDAGAVILGKANMDEFAMGSSTENSAFGPTSNPRNLALVPGGSSGGSAASVAAGYCPLALGSDTGGSIRQPAAFCGVHGMKPTYGLVSRYGLVAFASSLDQIGPFARDLGDIALALDVISRKDPRDATCFPKKEGRYLDALERNSLRGLRIGLVKEYEGEKTDPRLATSVIHAARICQDAGAELVQISLKNAISYGLACYYIIAPAEASSNLARYDGVRYGFRSDAESLLEQYCSTRREFGDEVKRRILAGTYVLSSGYYDAYYLTAQKMRERIQQEFKQAFKDVDALLMPTTPTLPFAKGSVTS